MLTPAVQEGQVKEISHVSHFESCPPRAHIAVITNKTRVADHHVEAALNSKMRPQPTGWCLFVYLYFMLYFVQGIVFVILIFSLMSCTRSDHAAYGYVVGMAASHLRCTIRFTYSQQELYLLLTMFSRL